MKKILSVLAGILMLASVGSFAADRAHTLKIYNWADYIDEGLLTEFEKWYQEQTGEEVKIVYQLFDVNEVMLSKIELGKEDFDLVCPSDYIIERMLRQDLLLPIKRDFGSTPDYISNISPFITGKFNHVAGNGKNANDYAVAYMWGTTGILYNTANVTKEEASSWNCLKDPKFKGKIFMKDSFRDAYTCILIALNKEKIESGQVNIDDLTFDASDENIKLVEDWLNDVKGNVAGWEADFGKEMMTKEKGWINMTYSGDAQWAKEEASLVGVNLDYTVPEEGSIVWFDGWVIPKYAKNVKAAQYFINFMCKPENALRNMEATGYVSAVGGPEMLEAAKDSTAYQPQDITYFFGEAGKGVCVNPIQYPSDEIIKRCGMEHDNGEQTEALLAMWSRVKSDGSKSVILYVFVVGIFALVCGIIITRKNNKKRNRRVRR